MTSQVLESLRTLLNREPTTDEIRACNLGWVEGYEAAHKLLAPRTDTSRYLGEICR